VVIEEPTVKSSLRLYKGLTENKEERIELDWRELEDGWWCWLYQRKDIAWILL